VDGAALLDSYVLDACIMQRPQVASLDPERFCVIELLKSPLFLVSNASHGLSCEKGITASDLASHAQLMHLNILPVATRSATERLHAGLLGMQTLIPAESDRATSLAESPFKENIYYVNALGLGQPDRVCIDFDVNYMTSDYVVILRENVEAPGVQLLLDELRLSLRTRAARLPQLICVL
jgi:hypothetical protein